MLKNRASHNFRLSFHAAPIKLERTQPSRPRVPSGLLWLLIFPTVLQMGGCCLPGDPSCHIDPPNADVSGTWQFLASMPGDMGAVEWLLELDMSPDGRVTGVAPVGRITLFLDIELGNSVEMVREQKAVSGQVKGNKVELRFDALHTGKGSVTYQGRFTGPNELGGDDWMAERS